MRSTVNGIEQTTFIGIPQAASAAFSFPLLNNQKPGFFRLIGVEDDADEETQALHDQETGRSVPLHFDPAPSRYCNRGMVCLPVRIWSHAYDLCGKANPRTMWLWESMRSFSKAVPSCYNF